MFPLYNNPCQLKHCLCKACSLNTCLKHVQSAFAVQDRGISIVAKSRPVSDARDLDEWAVGVVCHPPWTIAVSDSVKFAKYGSRRAT